MRRTAESLHPDLSALSEHYSAMGEFDGSQSKEPYVLFLDPHYGFASHCMMFDQAVQGGNTHIIAFSINYLGHLIGKRLSALARKNGFMSTEFNKSQVKRAGYGQFEGAFSFRDVYASA